MRRFFILAVTAMAGSCSPGGSVRPDIVAGETLSADGVPIRYEVRGAGQPTLVLVHGWSNDRTIWGEHLETLPDTYRVVALDLAGHGMSGTERVEWTIEAFGQDVVAVADHLGLDEVVLVGFSLGAAVVLEAAERMPERVQGVVFVDSFNDEDRALTSAAAEQIEAMFRANWRDTAFVRAFAYLPDAPDSLVRATTYSMPEQPGEHLFAMLPEYTGWIEREFEPTVRGIDAPIAAISTTRSPTDVEAMRELAPGFTLDTIAGVGHAGILHRRVGDFDAKLLALVRRFSGPVD